MLATYLSAYGKGLISLLNDRPWWNPLQLEHLLAAVHVGASSGSPHIANLREFVESLYDSESFAVRQHCQKDLLPTGLDLERRHNGIQRIRLFCWRAIQAIAMKPELVLGGDKTTAWNLHQALVQRLLRTGLDKDEMRSEFERLYWALETEYPWANAARLKRWMNLALGEILA